MGYAKISGAILDEIKERMHILGINDCIVFINGCVVFSDLDNSMIPELSNDIRNFEYENRCIVYAAIYNEFKEIGNHLTLLYVSYEHQDEWEAEKEDLKAMEPIAYVMNLTYPELSEYGTVVLRSHDGVLERIG